MADEQPDRRRVARDLALPRRERTAERVRHPSPGQRRLEQFARGGNHVHLDAGNWNRIPRLHGHVVAARPRFDVPLVRLGAAPARLLDRVAVVDEVEDR